jgi:hypothetical protein
MCLELRPWAHAHLYALVFAIDNTWGRLAVNEANVGVWGWRGHVGLATVAVIVYRVDGGQRPFLVLRYVGPPCWCWCLL